jgi:hypothetical protein
MSYLSQIINECEAHSHELLLKTPELSYSDYEKSLFTQTKRLVEHKEKRNQLSQSNAFTSLPPLDLTHTQNTQVTIIGAGSAGLLAAFQLIKAGFSVTVYEKRSKALSTLRYPNISFKEGEQTLRPLLGDTIYQRFLSSGGSLDGRSGKLRLTIGRFQEILLDELSLSPNFKIHFNQTFSFDNKTLYEGSDLILIASGAHAAERLSVEKELTVERFPNHNAKGITALYVKSSNGPHGYYRKDIDGYHWRRDNKSVYSGEAFSHDLKRVAYQIDDKQIKAQLSQLIQANSVEYTFSFGNDTPHFFNNPPLDIDPILLARYEVKPQIALTPVFQKENKTVIAIGDANGTPHPLAAIGTLKFVRNVIHLKTFLTRQCQITQTDNINKVALSKMNHKWYENEAMRNIEEVFFANIFCSLYSMPRE